MPLTDPSTGDALPEGGSLGDVLTLAEEGVEWGAPKASFRGVWEADAVLAEFNFASASLSDARLTTARAGQGLIEYRQVAPVGSPFLNSLFLRLDNASTAHWAKLMVDISGFEGISRVSYKAMSSPRGTHAYGDNTLNKGQVDGLDAFVAARPPAAWTDFTIPVGPGGQVATILMAGNYGAGEFLGRTEMGMYVHTVSVYGRAVPYDTNQFVTYGGKMWKSLVDSNAAVPGTGSTWVEALELPRSHGTTAQRPDPAAAGVGYPYFDETLVRPIWSSGTAWVDATGTAV